ncbi:hypothetical protein [Streptomyces albipurpureus]|uniref:Uncharacterized protein n=1 Tax=Streptomyces albipurpureus TaxID=2897419 RepID=A0ABT0UQT7_9ACTN|nr:hypothetical protein [Streptomyces sp. CWNU-1]MCM2389753.1 hypothetical protein [Streptomyces sp. CWNU-1]
MDLRSRLRRRAVQSPVVLVAVLPGATELRLDVEAELRRRGWDIAGAPAVADLLVVCGSPDPDVGRRLDTLRRAMPQPALRVDVSRPGRAAQALDEGLALLSERAASPSESASGHEDAGAGEHQAHSGSGSAPAEPGHGAPHGHEHQHPGHEAAGHTEQDAHGGHGGHDHHAMSTVAGLPMADRADDRDGLRLDRLLLPLGPVLADWPAGLILRCALQGDIVQEVRVDRLPGPPDGTSFWNEPWLRASRGEPVALGVGARRRCAAHLDSLGRLLSLAGWGDPAARLRRLRDEVLDGAPAGQCGERLRAVAGRVERSRTLRWGLAGLGRLPAERARRWGVTGPALEADGDVHDRLLVWLREARRAVRDFDDVRPLPAGELIGPRGTVGGSRPPSQALLDVLPELLAGAEFGCARLIVASLDPDVDESVAVSAGDGAHV